MKSKHNLLSMVIIGALVAACNSQAAAPAAAMPTNGANGTYTNIPPAQLAEMLESKDFLFVNTHVPYEGEIDPTDAFIPFEVSGPQRVGDYPSDRDAKIVLYCRSGRMSAIVAQELVQAGYRNVWNLEGGMIAWEAAGYALQGR